MRYISYDDTIARLNWPDAVEALRAGHSLPRAQIADMFLGEAHGNLLSRGAWIEGLGFGVKSVTIFDGNPQQGLPTIQGAMLVFDARHGVLDAVVEGNLVTEIKTAADSLLGALYLARPDSRHLLIVGGGTVARSLVKAYTACFPDLDQVSIWARRPEQAQVLAAEFDETVEAVTDLRNAAGLADIISTATLARAPVVHGGWIKPGSHVDLIGAYTPDMREADDALMARASLYVDSRDSTVHHIGELIDPIANGTLTEASILGDLYDLAAGPTSVRHSKDQITVFKNGGGAHLDLMIAQYVAGQVLDS